MRPTETWEDNMLEQKDDPFGQLSRMGTVPPNIKMLFTPGEEREQQEAQQMAMNALQLGGSALPLLRSSTLAERPPISPRTIAEMQSPTMTLEPPAMPSSAIMEPPSMAGPDLGALRRRPPIDYSISNMRQQPPAPAQTIPMRSSGLSDMSTLRPPESGATPQQPMSNGMTPPDSGQFFQDPQQAARQQMEHLSNYNQRPNQERLQELLGSPVMRGMAGAAGLLGGAAFGAQMMMPPEMSSEAQPQVEAEQLTVDPKTGELLPRWILDALNSEPHASPAIFDQDSGERVNVPDWATEQEAIPPLEQKKKKFKLRQLPGRGI